MPHPLAYSRDLDQLPVVNRLWRPAVLAYRTEDGGVWNVGKIGPNTWGRAHVGTWMPGVGWVVFEDGRTG